MCSCDALRGICPGHPREPLLPSPCGGCSRRNSPFAGIYDEEGGGRRKASTAEKGGWRRHPRDECRNHPCELTSVRAAFPCWCRRGLGTEPELPRAAGGVSPDFGLRREPHSVRVTLRSQLVQLPSEEDCPLHGSPAVDSLASTKTSTIFVLRNVP